MASSCSLSNGTRRLASRPVSAGRLLCARRSANGTTPATSAPFCPRLAASLLAHRENRLDAAKDRATQSGWGGVTFLGGRPRRARTRRAFPTSRDSNSMSRGTSHRRKFDGDRVCAHTGCSSCQQHAQLGMDTAMGGLGGSGVRSWGGFGRGHVDASTKWPTVNPNPMCFSFDAGADSFAV